MTKQVCDYKEATGQTEKDMSFTTETPFISLTLIIVILYRTRFGKRCKKRILFMNSTVLINHLNLVVTVKESELKYG